MKVDLCEKAAVWAAGNERFGPVYLCEEHHLASDMRRLVKRGLLVMTKVEGEEKRCQYEKQRRLGPGTYPRASKRVLFG